MAASTGTTGSQRVATVVEAEEAEEEEECLAQVAARASSPWGERRKATSSPVR